MDFAGPTTMVIFRGGLTMDADAGEQPAAAAPPPMVGTVRNIGEPLRFANVEPLAGFSAGPAQGGQQVEVCFRLALTSDEPFFHRLVENFSGVIDYMAEKAGTAVNLRRANTVLLIFKPDNIAELWVDAAAIALQCTVKRALAANSVVFEDDIADVTGMSFPCVTIGEKDKVLCLFREGWSFGLAFDFNPGGQLDLERFQATLGTLHRRLCYRHLYAAVADASIFDKLMAVGWFPFVEIITTGFRDLTQYAKAGFDIAEIEKNYRCVRHRAPCSPRRALGRKAALRGQGGIAQGSHRGFHC
jgi:hypothetical protein